MTTKIDEENADHNCDGDDEDKAGNEDEMEMEMEMEMNRRIDSTGSVEGEGNYSTQRQRYRRTKISREPQVFSSSSYPCGYNKCGDTIDRGTMAGVAFRVFL